MPPQLKAVVQVQLPPALEAALTTRRFVMQRGEQARRSARAFVESSESIDPARLRAMLAVFTEREA